MNTLNFKNNKILQIRRNKTILNSEFSFFDDYASSQIINRLKILNKKFDKCLLIGCRSVNLINYLSQICNEIHLTDISDKLLKQHDNIKIKSKIISDMDNMPYDCNSFDLIIPYFTTHILEDTAIYLLKISAILKEEGICLGSHYSSSISQAIQNEILKYEISDSNKLVKVNSNEHIHYRAFPIILDSTFINFFHKLNINAAISNEYLKIKYKNLMSAIRDIRCNGENGYKKNKIFKKDVALKIIANNNSIIINAKFLIFIFNNKRNNQSE